MSESLISHLLSRLRKQRTAFVLLYGYGVQILAAIMSLVFAPYILRSIGPEAYGLVGLYMIMQAIFQLLDGGLTPALSRETARYQGGAVSDNDLRSIIRGLESVVMLSAIPLLALALILSPFIASHWVKLESLSVDDVVIALNLIMMILLLRWVSGVRRGVLTGFERHITLYNFTAGVAILRFPCIILFFSVVTPTSTSYFLYQLFISVLEALTLWVVSGRQIPSGLNATIVGSIKSLRSIARFAANHGGLAILGVMISQSDKLLLSRNLSLSQFGYYSLAVAAAAGVNLIVLPINQMLMPRLSRLMAEGDDAAVLVTYSRSARAMTVVLSVVTVLFAAFGHAIMLAWTGDKLIADLTGPVLAWYAIGNMAMAMAAFSYYIQYAAGNLRMHTQGTIGFLCLIIPALWLSVSEFGMLGAAITRASIWILYLLTWVTWTHRKFLHGRHWQWLFNDVLMTFLPVCLGALALRWWFDLPTGRVALALTLIGYASVLFLVAVLSSRLLPIRQLWQSYGKFILPK